MMADEKVIKRISYSTKRLKKFLVLTGGVWFFLFLLGYLAGQDYFLKSNALLFTLVLLGLLFIINLGVYWRLYTLRKFIEVSESSISVPSPFSTVVKVMHLADVTNVSLHKYECLKRGQSHILWIVSGHSTERLDDLFIDVEDLQWLEAHVRNRIER